MRGAMLILVLCIIGHGLLLVYVLMPLCVYAHVFRTQQNLCQGNICLYVFMPLCRVILILGMLHYPIRVFSKPRIDLSGIG